MGILEKTAFFGKSFDEDAGGVFDETDEFSGGYSLY